MTQKVSSRSVATASCLALRTERSHTLRRMTGGQPTITRLLGKMSVVPLRIQTEMPNRCMEGRLAREIQPPLVEPKILKAQAVPKAQEIGLHPVPVGSPVVRKIQVGPPVAEIEIQEKDFFCTERCLLWPARPGGKALSRQAFPGRGGSPKPSSIAG